MEVNLEREESLIRLTALSVKQPFASQIASGEKTIEYRSWPTPYRGNLLIVSSKKPIVDALPSGCTVALVSLTNCRKSDGEGWEWDLENPRSLEPFPIRGNTGLYIVQVPADLLAAIKDKK